MDHRSQGAGRIAVGYGSGVHHIAIDVQAWDPAALAARVEAIFASPTYTPPALPEVAMRVLALSRRDDVDLRQVATLLGQDPVLAGRLLRLANSPIYRGATPTRTLKQAMARLGLSTMRDMVMTEALNQKVFKTGGGYADSLEELRVHSVMTGHLAQLVCKRTAIDSEYAFLCGMLHDIGFAAILIAMGNVERGKVPPPLDMLWPVADQAHARVGAFVAKLWRFPEELGVVIARHHHPLFEGRIHPVIAVLQVAELLAFENGVALLPKLGDGTVMMDVDSRLDIDVMRAREALRLDDPALDALRVEADRIVSTLKM